MTTQTNTDGRFKDGRDERNALDLFRQAYAVNNEDDYNLLIAYHAKQAKEFEEARTKRVESGASSALENLQEGYKQIEGEAQARKEAKITRAKAAQAKEDQEREDRKSELMNSLKK